MRRTRFPIFMLVAGLGLGFGLATLMWQGPLERRGKLIEESQANTDKAIAVANQNLKNLQECTAAISRFVRRGS